MIREIGERCAVNALERLLQNHWRFNPYDPLNHSSKQPNPCVDAAVKALRRKTRKAYAKRNALPHKQRALAR